MITPPQAILFDWDDTLVKSSGVINNALNETLKRFDKPPLSDEELQKGCCCSSKSIFEILFGHDSVKARDEFFTIFSDIPLNDRAQVIPGSLAFLQKMLERQIPMGIVSNKTGDLLRQEVQYLGWEKYFQVVVGSGDTPQDKPSPVPIAFALEKMRLQPSHHIWFIGDSVVDWSSAKSCGCHPMSIHITPHDPTVMHINHFEHLEELVINQVPTTRE